MKARTISEHVIEGKRLGRHVEHDPRSRNYAYQTVMLPSYKTIHHRRYGVVLDQGNIGSCTGNAAAGIINTVPVHFTTQHTLRERDALDLYELATTLDSFPGEYPPDDTGSSGLAAAKAAKLKGYITEYRHAFSLDSVLAALQEAPVITGVDWYEGFDYPDLDTGLVKIDGQVRGGHEFEVLGFQLKRNLADSLVFCENSWGVDWGLNGRFCFTVATWQKLLDAEGDVTILLRS